MAATVPHSASSAVTIDEAPVSVRILLPAAVYAHYSALVEGTAQSLESLLAARLEACQDHSADKPLYFTDKDRQELERLLRRNVFNTADALLQMRNALSVRVSKVIISIAPNVLQRLKTRVPQNTSWEKFIEERITQALEVYVGLR